MQGKMHPSKNFKDVQEPTNIDFGCGWRLVSIGILGTSIFNDVQKTCHYFVDLEGSGANGHNDEKDDKSNGRCN